MYCIQCGVKLADSERKCPLCGTVPYHPEISRQAVEPMYPNTGIPSTQINRFVLPVIFTGLFALAMFITVLSDMQLNDRISWSGYAAGGIAVGYVVWVLPMWFRKANPVIFIPCIFVAAALYILYIDIATQGGWFLSFGLPVTGFFGLWLTAQAALLRYLKRGHLFVLGGASILLGGFMPVMELLIWQTFQRPRFVGWSWHPMAVLVILGGILIFLGISRPARETMEKKLFL